MYQHASDRPPHTAAAVIFGDIGKQQKKKGMQSLLSFCIILKRQMPEGMENFLTDDEFNKKRAQFLQ